MQEVLDSRTSYRISRDRSKFSSRQQDIPRPCYYLLQILGLWLPVYAKHWSRKYYYYGISWFISFGSFVSAILIWFFKSPPCYNKIELLIDNTFLSLSLLFPFLYCRIYFEVGYYDRLLVNVINGSSTSISRLSKLYSCMSLFFWFFCFLFFYKRLSLHLGSYKESGELLFLHVLLALAVLYLTGYWACWLSIYAFVCHVHKIQIDLYCYKIRDRLGHSNRKREVETCYVTNLIYGFHDVREWTERTQGDFSKINSIDSIHHILNTALFLLVYLFDEFNETTSYNGGRVYVIMGVLFDSVSVIAKLYSSAIVSMALHNIVLLAGGYCTVDYESTDLPKERLAFHQLVLMREEDMGFFILGVKITSTFTVGLFTTVATASLTMAYYAKDFVQL